MVNNYLNLIIDFLDYIIGVYFLWLFCCVFYFGWKIGGTEDPFEKYGLVMLFVSYCTFGIL
jgi:hypothetical protein